MQKLIPVGVSNRHLHVSREVLEKLFGISELTVYKSLYQKGEFASEQIVEMIGPAGKFSHVRILGALRNYVQVEVSGTDAYHLGIHPPVGKFAALPEGESVTLKGPKGSLVLTENIMIARRHIHINPTDAAELGVKDKDTVFVAPAHEKGDKMESRLCIMGNVLIRVHEDFLLQMHIDMDEANAIGLKTGDQVFIVSNSIGFYEDPTAPDKKLITESDVRQAILKKQKILIKKGIIVTPAARDLGNAHHIFTN